MVNKSPLNILIIEDNLINQKLAATLFKRIGHQVDLAMNGKLGVELFTKKQYDLVLMDIQMPVMTGIEATEAIRKVEMENNVKKPVIIIAVTTFNNEVDRENCLKAGMNDHISKPYKPKDILQIVADNIPGFTVPEYI